jgi:hypothetical protein
MPKLPTDYSHTIIYHFICNDALITHNYIGSTTNFTKRKSHHKYCCNNNNSKEYLVKKYSFIRENGGWDNWKMIEIEKFPCKDKREAEAREQYWIDLQNNKLNTICAVRDYHSTNSKEKHSESNKKWYAKRTNEYKEQILLKRREYYKQNAEKLRQKALNRYYCIK